MIPKIEFSTFKYQHTEAAIRSGKRWIFIGICVGVGLFVLIMWSKMIPLWVIPLVAALIAYFSAPKHLLIGTRYLLCGTTIIYYSNVTQCTNNLTTLTIKTNKGQRWTLERDKFPTGARHEPKITKNKQEKFDKVSAKIIEKIKKAQSNAIITTT